MKKVLTATKDNLFRLTAAVVILLLPVISFSQVGPPADPGENNNPEAPFDDNMNLAFLAIGLVLVAVVIYRRLQHKAVHKG
jgi:hypothetical protein